MCFGQLIWSSSKLPSKSTDSLSLSLSFSQFSNSIVSFWFWLPNCLLDLRTSHSSFHSYCYSTLTVASIASAKKNLNHNLNQNQFLKSVRDQCKSRSFRNVDHALGLLDTMLHMHPLPSIDDFNHTLVAIARLKHYPVVISLIKWIKSFGIFPDVYTLTILINCFCHLNRVDFEFFCLGNNFETWLSPRLYYSKHPCQGALSSR